MRKILHSPQNNNQGFVLEELSNLCGFLDGTGLQIARPGNGAQNGMWNGYKHMPMLGYQGISFTDGLVVLEGAVPGYQPDTMVWLNSDQRIEFGRLMDERVANGQQRLKLYADKIYRTSPIVTAAFNLRNNPGGLNAWQVMQNRIMSDIRVAIEWSFGKIVQRYKYVTFGKTMFLQGSPVNQYYHVGVFLENCHTCFYGSQHTRYFLVAPPSIEEYMAQ